MSFLLGYKFDNINIGYSYDITISKLIGSTGGAHEISIIYNFDLNQTRKKRRKAIPCSRNIL